MFEFWHLFCRFGAVTINYFLNRWIWAGKIYALVRKVGWKGTIFEPSLEAHIFNMKMFTFHPLKTSNYWEIPVFVSKMIK